MPLLNRYLQHAHCEDLYPDMLMLEAARSRDAQPRVRRPNALMCGCSRGSVEVVTVPDQIAVSQIALRDLGLTCARQLTFSLCECKAAVFPGLPFARVVHSRARCALAAPLHVPSALSRVRPGSGRPNHRRTGHVYFSSASAQLHSLERGEGVHGQPRQDCRSFEAYSHALPNIHTHCLALGGRMMLSFETMPRIGGSSAVAVSRSFATTTIVGS